MVFKDSVPFDMTLKQVMSSPAGPIVDEDTFDADKLVRSLRRPVHADRLQDQRVRRQERLLQGPDPGQELRQVKYFADEDGRPAGPDRPTSNCRARAVNSPRGQVAKMRSLAGHRLQLQAEHREGQEGLADASIPVCAWRQPRVVTDDRPEEPSTSIPRCTPDGLGHDDRDAYGDGTVPRRFGPRTTTPRVRCPEVPAQAPPNGSHRRLDPLPGSDYDPTTTCFFRDGNFERLLQQGSQRSSEGTSPFLKFRLRPKIPSRCCRVPRSPSLREGSPSTLPSFAATSVTRAEHELGLSPTAMTR